MEKISAVIPEAIQTLKEPLPLINSMSEFEQNRVLEFIQGYLPKKYWEIETVKTDLLTQSFDQSVFIWGASGRGKSVFAASLAKEYIRKSIPIRWFSFPKLIMELQSMWRDKESDPFQKAKEIAGFNGILFLDDFGAEKLTEYVRQIIYFLCNEREEKILITVFTSNYNLRQIDEQIDSRISSRIAGMCRVLEFTGEDRRLKK